MRRLLILMVLGTSCKKKEEPPPEPVPSAPSRGMSVTTLKDPATRADAGAGQGDGGVAAGSASALTDGGVPPDAPLYGGDGSPPYIDDEGHLHGPGGRVFMGRGVECNAERNHCLREPAWFAVGNLVAGKLYRAVPVFEFEGKWHNWRGKEEEFTRLLRTEVGTKETLHPGDPVIWFIDENAEKKFVDTEYDALTSSRWEAGVIDSVAPDKIHVKGWTYGTVPIDTVRVIVEQRTH